MIIPTHENLVAVVGGGISGLSAAYHWKMKSAEAKMPFHCVVVEKENRLGGTILTETVDGFVIEGGPDCFFTEKPEALALCRRLGLQDRLLMTNEQHHHTFILWKGRLHELPQGFMLLAPSNLSSFIRDTLISPLGRIRMAMDLFIPAKRSGAEESLAQFVQRRLGSEVLEKIAEPLVAGVHASSPETMSLKSTFPRFIELEQHYGSLIRGMMKRRKEYRKRYQRKGQEKPAYTMFMTLKNGLVELINALAGTLGQEVILNGKSVVAVEKTRSNGPPSSARFLIRFADGDSLPARAVVLATPSYRAAEILKGLDTSLAEELGSIPFVSTATVSLAYDRKDVSHPLDGFGFVIPRKEEKKIMASTWTSMKFANRAPSDRLLIRCFVGGARNEHLCYLSEQEIASLAQAELREILGIQAQPLLTKVYRWEKSMPQYTLGHADRVRRIEERLTRHPGLFLCGGSYWGIGISDCIKSGEKAAGEIVRFLESQA